jgi:phosphatidylserine/phosphatidylglycerophosphate/cardiolipin synthase-like enzyme
VTKFLVTTGISHHLEQLINEAKRELILISPYLQLNDRLRESLEDKDALKIDVRIVYGKSELQPDQINLLKTLKSVRTSYCKNLHAKCYMNEKEAIVTSMNLYEYSQVHNHEMGLYITKEKDPELFEDIYDEARRLIRISEEVRLSVEKIVEPEQKAKEKKPKKKSSAKEMGFCIRCKKEIKLNPEAPYCANCFKSWKKYENPVYEEKYCHFCGKDNTSTMNKPVCYTCYKSK